MTTPVLTQASSNMAAVWNQVQRVWKGRGAPIAIAGITGGIWAKLAFFPLRLGGASLFISVAFALGFMACFSATLVGAYFWASDVGRVRQLQDDLARCSLAIFPLAIFLPEYVARLHPPLFRSDLLLVTFVILWLILCSQCVSKQRSVSWSERKIVIHAMILLVVLLSVTTAIAIRKYLVFGYVGQDLAYFSQIMYTTLHGHLFWGNLLQDLLYSRPVTTDFAGHNSPIMTLFLPFYGIWPSPITLLILRNIMLFACAIPVYMLARTRVPPFASCIWSAALLLTPAFLYQSEFDFYPLTFAALPLLFAIYLYVAGRYTGFCVALALTLAVREDLVFVAFGLGLLALLQRRTKRWTLLPILAAMAWGIISFMIVLPAALHGATFVTDACFRHLGGDRAGVMRNILLRPKNNIFVHANVVYLKTLLTPSGLILSLGSALSLISFPFIAINLLAGAGPCITTVIFAQYSIVPAILLFAGSLLAATDPEPRSWWRRMSALGLNVPSVAPLVCVALSCASLIFVTDTVQVNELRRQPWTDEAIRVIGLIPKGASVAAPRYLLPHLANRDCLYQTHRLVEYHSAIYEYLVIDNDGGNINAAQRYRAQYQQLVLNAAADPHLQTIYQSPQYRVYRNPQAHGISCADRRDVSLMSQHP